VPIWKLVLSHLPNLPLGNLLYNSADPSFGDVSFYRLRRPVVEHTGEQDWQLDVEALKSWMASRNDTSFKFVLSPTTLTPFFGGSHLETEWREAVLEILAYIPNVIVLAEAECMLGDDFAHPRFRLIHSST
jgi:hypothetical protein